jgi:large subunit ribosomal protein L4
MELKLQALGGAASRSVNLPDQIFARPYNEGLVHQVVTSYMAGARQGSKAQKTRAEVRGGGRKPWKQKGTGRARAGSTRGPLWRGGGVTFAAKPRNYEQKVNRKAYRLAISMILSELTRQGRLVVVEALRIAEPRTKLMVALLKQLSMESALFIAEEVDTNLYLSVRNIPGIGLLDTRAIDPVSLIHFDKVVITEAALRQIEEWLS